MMYLIDYVVPDITDSNIVFVVLYTENVRLQR